MSRLLALVPAVTNDPAVPHPNNSPWVAILTIVVVAGVAGIFWLIVREYLKNSQR